MKKYKELDKLRDHFLSNHLKPWEQVLYRHIDFLEVHSELKCRPHKFSCGEGGEVVDEITVKIKLPRLNIQPHDGFEECVIEAFVKAFIEGEVAGWLDNE